jgi:hypothetical protein
MKRNETTKNERFKAAWSAGKRVGRRGLHVAHIYVIGERMAAKYARKRKLSAKQQARWMQYFLDSAYNRAGVSVEIANFLR